MAGRYLIESFLPPFDLGDNDFQTDSTTSRALSWLGGMTAYGRPTASGLWRKKSNAPPVRDDLVIYEVMADRLDDRWWRDYRRRLETRFWQDELVIRAYSVRAL